MGLILPASAQEEIQHRQTGQQEARTGEEKAALKANRNGLDIHLSANGAQRGSIS